MSKKNRSEVSLTYFAGGSRSDLSEKCTRALRYTPVVSWGSLILKDPYTGRDIEYLMS